MPTINKTTLRFQDNAGIRRRNIGIYTGPASYVTGGDPCTVAQLGLDKLEIFLTEHGVDDTPEQYILVYNRTTSKIMWFLCDDGDEVDNATDLSGIDVRFEAVGH